MVKPVVRAIAICVVLRGGDIFVFEGHDAIKGENFYRPLGGTIEFGERSSQAVLREMREEINADVENLLYLGTLESIFIHEGQPGHEIVLVHQADFADTRLYDKESVMGREDNGGQFKALWKPLADFQNGQYPLYPDGLLELLTTK